MKCECGCGGQTSLITTTQRRDGRIAGHYNRFIRGHATRTSPVEYLADPKTQCWIWQLTRNGKGYGQTYFRGKVELSHRVAFMKHVGPIPAGMNVLHRCDNPPCVNPAHLFLGDQADNIADCVSKGRHAKGEGNGRAILTADQVANIRALRNSSMMQREIADQFNVTQSTVSRILSSANWKRPC